MRTVETILTSCHESIKRLRQFVDSTHEHNSYKPSDELTGAEQIITTTLDWVSTTQFGKIHSEHCNRRAAGTCQWLTGNPKFDAWLSGRSSSSVLWLRGDGKSVPQIFIYFVVII